MTTPTITYLDGAAVQTTGFDARNLKEGNEVLIRARVIQDGVDGDCELWLDAGRSYGRTYASADNVVGVVAGDAPAQTPEPAPQRLGDVAKDLRVGQRVRVTYEGVVGELDATYLSRPARIDLDGGDEWEWPTASALVEVLPEQPLAVGDRIWHRNAQRGETREIKAITQIGGVDHLLFEPFDHRVHVPLVAYPAADYVRAQ